MTYEEFSTQVERLKADWKNAYGPERIRILWKVFAKEPESRFSAAVDWCIGNCRGAPMLEDLSKGIQVAQRDEAQVRASYGVQGMGMMGVMNSAARENRCADREFVRACLNTLRDFLDTKLTREQFFQGCSYLEESARALK